MAYMIRLGTGSEALFFAKSGGFASMHVYPRSFFKEFNSYTMAQEFVIKKVIFTLDQSERKDLKIAEIA